MSGRPSALSGWTPQQTADGKGWVATCRTAGTELARIHRKELRELDTFSSIAKVGGPADYRVAPCAPKPTSGVVEQQRWFSTLRRS
jgi:hypothetical protein